MKKEDVLRMLRELELTDNIVDLQEGDLVLKDLMDTGLSRSSATRILESGVAEGKLIKLKSYDENNRRINVYRENKR